MTSPSPPEFPPDIVVYNDTIAAKYDDLTKTIGWGANGLIARSGRYWQPADVHAGLDLGAGTGQTIQAVDDLFHPRLMIAVDASSKMLEQLQNRRARPGLEIVHSTIEDYANSNRRAFDLITAIGSLEFVQDLPHVVGKLATFLTARGTMFFTYIPQTEPDTSERTFQVPHLKAAFTEYYWPREIIEGALTARGLAFASTSFAAYQRGKKTVMYDFIAASRKHTD